MATRHEVTCPSGGVDESAQWNYGFAEIRTIREQVSITSADTEENLVQTLPANAKVLYAQMNFDTAIGLATAVKVGLGWAADPDSIALSGTTVTQNTKTTAWPSDVTVSSETTLQVAATDTNGADAGSFNADATVSVLVVYALVAPIADAS